MPKLGVNIDHVATLRQARRGLTPDPVSAALLCEIAGADSIVAHLREDRRHIQDKDIKLLRKKIKTRLNLEMSIASSIVNIACKIKPYQATLVPENREELTTEGGLDILANSKKITAAVNKLEKAGIFVSLFIDPDFKQITASKNTGVKMIELHTGNYANAKNVKEKKILLNKIKAAVDYAKAKGLKVFAGHGLDYQNVLPIAKIPGIEELNIGYSIICQALYTGLPKAVAQMRELIN
ncbi:MAG: pyridoxine 5'-phosphate synthase [Candidatus Omnitrophica bacterium]|nr:pyridoxine 5'-phosphate synthase [Candidatus Omnitrophota bacterium]